MNALAQERHYLAQLLEAIQRSAYFLDQCKPKIAWPLTATYLAERRKDAALLETLSAMNERIAKLQDTSSGAMRHASLLMGERTDSFLKVLVFFEKLGVLDSAEQWQQARLARNIAARDDETNDDAIAEHLNSLASLSGPVLETARRLIERIGQDLGIKPQSGDFEQEFRQLFSA